MDLLAALGMLVALLTLAALLGVGGRGMRPGPGGEASGPGSWPPAALIIPVAGDSYGLAANLRSRLTQDYPRYQVILVTCSLDDPAVPVILSLLRERSQARHVVAGPAASCGQKNHNLLAGIGMVEEDIEVLVFADANQMATSHWLRDLVSPLARGEVQVVSGYHHVLSQRPGVAAAGRAATVLLIYLLKSLPWLDQPWGGATAISRSMFQQLKVGRQWAQTVVDDVSLAVLLKRAGIRPARAPGAVLTTPLAEDTFKGWQDWFTRQVLFLKLYCPLTWLAAGVAAYLWAFLVVMAGCQALGALGGIASPWAGVASLLFLGAFAALIAYARRLHPSPGPLLPWLAGCLALSFLAPWCHARTWLAGTVKWRGLIYRMAWGGRVTKVESN